MHGNCIITQWGITGVCVLNTTEFLTMRKSCNNFTKCAVLLQYVDPSGDRFHWQKLLIAVLNTDSLSCIVFTSTDVSKMLIIISTVNVREMT